MKFLEMVKKLLGLTVDPDDEALEVDIYFEDLKPEKQDELLSAMGGIEGLNRYPLISLWVEEGGYYYA